eukprot:5996147-Amphidinium_carterae.2
MENQRAASVHDSIAKHESQLARVCSLLCFCAGLDQPCQWGCACQARYVTMSAARHGSRRYSMSCWGTSRQNVPPLLPEGDLLAWHW